MLTPQDLSGISAMMPAFATDDAGDPQARNTVDVDRLARGVDRMVSDGADIIATTGSFGESYALLPDEFETLVRATVETVRRRVPVLVGMTFTHTREYIERMRFIRESGADGVLAAVPFYFPATVDNAVQFYLDLADAYPDFPILIYHNPPLHRVRLPIEAVARLAERPNIVGMKDSHRDVLEFCHLMRLTQGKLAVFVNQTQMFPLGLLGAAGCWSIFAWMGPWPVLRLRDACRAGDWATAQQIGMDLATRAANEDLYWRESGSKLAINFAGYCEAGPLRPPFRHIPPEVIESTRAIAKRWGGLVEKYGPVTSEVRPA
jgi:dihydrodipicolinate synthase/N-acetylneuraminate lyase